MILASLLFVVVLTGCGPAQKAAIDPDVVAKVGTRPIRRKELSAALLAKEATDPKQKVEVLNELIREESIYQAARAAHFEEDPAVASAIRNLIVSRYRDQTLSGTNVAATEAEIEAAYAANLTRFTSPPLVSVAMIHVHCSPKATPEKRLEAEKKARELWEKAKASTPDQFADLALAHSEDQSTRYQGGQSGWLPEKGSSRFDPAVHEAVAALKEAGELAPLISSPTGFYVVRLVARKPASARPLKEVADGLKYQIVRKKTEDMQQARLSQLLKTVDVKINEAVLRDLPMPAPEPVTPPSGPGTSTAQVSQPQIP